MEEASPILRTHITQHICLIQGEVSLIPLCGKSKSLEEWKKLISFIHMAICHDWSKLTQQTLSLSNHKIWLGKNAKPKEWPCFDPLKALTLSPMEGGGNLWRDGKVLQDKNNSPTTISARVIIPRVKQA